MPANARIFCLGERLQVVLELPLTCKRLLRVWKSDEYGSLPVVMQSTGAARLSGVLSCLSPVQLHLRFATIWSSDHFYRNCVHLLLIIIAGRLLLGPSLRAMASLHCPKPSRSLSFDIKGLMSNHDGARLGRLTLSGRVAMDTPHYVAVSSRGTVPHISQDMMRDNTQIRSMYTALEDCERTFEHGVVSTGHLLISVLLLELARHRESTFATPTCL